MAQIQIPTDTLDAMAAHSVGQHLSRTVLHELAAIVLTQAQKQKPASASTTEEKITHPDIQRQYAAINEYVLKNYDDMARQKVLLHLTDMRRSPLYYLALELNRLELLDKVKMS